MNIGSSVALRKEGAKKICFFFSYKEGCCSL